VFSRWMLLETAALVEEAGLAARLRAHLDQAPLPKPADFRGGPATDMFAVDLAVAEVARIEAILALAKAAGRTLVGTPERGLGGFVEAWAEYRRALSITQGA
jgi:hypothetical protein